MSSSDEDTLQPESGNDVLESVKDLADVGDRWFLAIARGLGRVARIVSDEGAVVSASARAAAKTTKKVGTNIVQDMRDELKRDLERMPFSPLKAESDLSRRERYLLAKLGEWTLKYDGRLAELAENPTYHELVGEIRFVRESIEARKRQAAKAEASESEPEDAAPVSPARPAQAGGPSKHSHVDALDELDALDAVVTPANSNERKDKL